jgi:hypothetical protein
MRTAVLIGSGCGGVGAPFGKSHRSRSVQLGGQWLAGRGMCDGLPAWRKIGRRRGGQGNGSCSGP